MNSCEHPERPAVARCVACGKVLCYECRTYRQRRNFCIDCAPGNPAGFRSPTFSMILSLIPGLGQVYAGSKLKGLLFLIAGGTSLALCSELPAVLPVAFWLYSIWDARMTALKRNYHLTKGGSGSPGAREGDWMLLLGATGLAGLYLGLPLMTGVVMEPWALWTGFLVVLVLAALLGRGGKNVKRA